MRPIDADALLASHWWDSLTNDFDKARAKIVVMSAPTVDAVEVVHGRWIISSDGYYPYCSECKEEPKHGEMTNYCPNCGAKMDGGNENG